MALYYLPLLIRSDRYFVSKLENPLQQNILNDIEYNFVGYADDRVLTPLITIEDTDKITINQLSPSDRQDIPLNECRVSLQEIEGGFELLIRKSNTMQVETAHFEAAGIRLDHFAAQKKISVGYYRHKVERTSLELWVTLALSETEVYHARFVFAIVASAQCQRVVIDFGSEASQVAYKNCGPQSEIVAYNILDNVMSRLSIIHSGEEKRREDFLNNEPGDPLLYRSFYAIKKKMTTSERENFPYNFAEDPEKDEVRLFITRKEVAVTQVSFRDQYEIIPNLKLGIEKSLQLIVDRQTEDYSIRSHKKQLISAVILRLLRLMISTKPEFRKGGIIVTLLVPNIYTQHDIFELLNELRSRTGLLLQSLQIGTDILDIEYETISESDAAFMGYQQTHTSDIKLSNGDMALVIDCGKGTTDISMLLADDNENYSSFFRTGFAGAGNVLSYGFAEDLLTLLLRTLPASNEASVKDFIRRYILEQNLTVDVLNFMQLVENQKKQYKKLQAVGISEFAQVAERSQSTERTIGNLYKDPSTLLQYVSAILSDRSIRWDDDITGIIAKASDCIVRCITGSITDVLTKDIRKRIKVVMLSGRAFYFDELRIKLEKELKTLLGDTKVQSVLPGRYLNNKNIAIHGAFSGAYKITDFTGMPIDKKEGLSRNNDVLNNNVYLYRGIKVQPGNDILYNTSVVKRNHQVLKSFRNKVVDIYFTRDNIYLRLMENQQVKDVRSLYNVLSAAGEMYLPMREMKTISLFPGVSSELSSINDVHEDVMQDRSGGENKQDVKKKNPVLRFLNL